MTEWWRGATVYQVYVPSFADADGDGMGDLAGIRRRLPYLADLGVDALWLTPCYPSPHHDHGYDVADYTGIDPRHGTLAGFDALVDTAHRYGLRLLLDIVPNHCAVTHPWFVEALAAPPGSPARQRFHFADGRDGPDRREGQPPNRWRSMFGGPAWSRAAGTDTGASADADADQWYLHLFTPGQPDLNWRHPDVAPMFVRVLRFWLDRGVDGFRVDAAQGLFKHPDLPDGDDPGADERVRDAANPLAWNQPEVHEVYRHWREVCAGYPGDRVLIGEVTGLAQAHLADYVRPDRLHQGFLFDLLDTPFDAEAMRAAICRGLAVAAETGSTATWVLGNHDTTRIVTRYGGGRPGGPAGDLARGAQRARAAMLALAALPGSLYVYQGDELGLPEVVDIPAGRRTDPIFHRSGGRRVGRDGCRVPLPWTAELDAKAWLPQPPWFAEYAVADQIDDPQSTLSWYRNVLRRRRERGLGASATGFDWLATPRQVLGFARDDLVCMLNTGDAPVPAPPGEPILATGSTDGGQLLPDGAGWWRVPR